MIDASDFGEEGMVTSMDGLKLSGDKPTTIGTGTKSSTAAAAATAVVSRHDEYEDMEDDSLALDESTTVAPGGLNGSTASVSPPSSSSTKMVILFHFKCAYPLSLTLSNTSHSNCTLHILHLL